MDKYENMCRCCLINKGTKDIFEENYFCGYKEVYENIIRNTFNIQIKKYDHATFARVICEDCVLKLGEIQNFKKIIEISEKTLQQYYTTIILEGSKLPTQELKVELIKEETAQDIDKDFDQQNPDMEAVDSIDEDEMLSNIKAEKNCDLKILKNSKLETVNKFNIKKTIKKTTLKEHTGTKNIKTKKDWLKIIEQRGNGPILRENALKLISNSSICVFQWNKSRYRCFCCQKPFSDINVLKQHTDTEHIIEEIEKKIINQQNRLVKVEVSNIICKICNAKVEHFNLLRNHLDTHNIVFEYGDDLLVPFKINDSELQCQICFQNFRLFRLLNIHVNKHFQNHVCHICGAGFPSAVFLNSHRLKLHIPRNCNECNINFANKLEKKRHDISVHNLKVERRKRFPCPYCVERFNDEQLRVMHCVEKHGMAKPEHKCSICPKTFVTLSLRNGHVKAVHMRQKKYECNLCVRLFYTKSDLNRHLVTHTGEKNFSCGVCNTLFATKCNLRRHMKRSHSGS